MNSPYKATNAIYDLYEKKTSRECSVVFSDFVASLGVSNYTLMETDLGCRQRDVLLGWSWTEEWRAFSRQAGHLHYDPMLAMIASDNHVFTLRERAAAQHADPEAALVLQRFSQFGWQDGLVVAIHRGGLRYGVASLVARRPLDPDSDKRELAATALAYHQRLRTLAPEEGFSLAPAGLNSSEVECIKLMSSGLSDIKAGEMMGVGGAAVHSHIESAKQKLVAHNRAELVSLAHSLAIIQ